MSARSSLCDIYNEDKGLAGLLSYVIHGNPAFVSEPIMQRPKRSLWQHLFHRSQMAMVMMSMSLCRLVWSERGSSRLPKYPVIEAAGLSFTSHPPHPYNDSYPTIPHSTPFRCDCPGTQPTIEPARDEEALGMMIDSFEQSGYEIKAVLRTIFNSDFFKNARYAKIKSPAEVVASTLKLVDTYREGPDPTLPDIGIQTTYMGQDLLAPPVLKDGTRDRGGSTAALCWPASTSWPTGWPTPACPG